MFPDYPKMKPIEISDRDAFEAVFASHRAEVCEMSFANLYIWQDFDRAMFTRMGDNLCIMINPLNEPPFFMEPIGEAGVAEAFDECMNHTGRISRASAPFVSKFANGCMVSALRDHYDYIYRTVDLASLSGRRFDGKRNHINALKKTHPDYEFVKLTRQDEAEAAALFELWAGHKNGNGEGVGGLSQLAVDCQRQALARTFEAYDELGIIGCGIRVMGKLAGFLIAGRQNADTVCVPQAYHRLGIQGVAPALLWEACKGSFSKFEYVNLEQDLGIEGLRRSKRSYYPLKLVEKYDVVEKGRTA